MRPNGRLLSDIKFRNRYYFKYENKTLRPTYERIVFIKFYSLVQSLFNYNIIMNYNYMNCTNREIFMHFKHELGFKLNAQPFCWLMGFDYQI